MQWNINYVQNEVEFYSNTQWIHGLLAYPRIVSLFMGGVTFEMFSVSQD